MADGDAWTVHGRSKKGTEDFSSAARVRRADAQGGRDGKATAFFLFRFMRRRVRRFARNLSFPATDGCRKGVTGENII